MTSKATEQPTRNDVPHIVGAMHRIMAGLGSIKKEQKNREQGFQFRGIDQVYNAIHPLMVEYGVYCRPYDTQIVARKERTTQRGGVLAFTVVSVCYDMISAVDGSVQRIGPVLGEGMDSGDKSTSKALAIAHKYALLQAFCVPTEDVVDPDRDAYTGIAPSDDAWTEDPSGFDEAPTVAPDVIEAPTETDAAEITNLLIGVANMCESVDGLKSLWEKNKKKIDFLDSRYPEQFARLKAAFSESYKKLK